MDTTTATARILAAGPDRPARLSEARRINAHRTAAVSRAKDAQRLLRARQARFAHLKRMYD